MKSLKEKLPAIASATFWVAVIAYSIWWFSLDPVGYLRHVGFDIQVDPTAQVAQTPPPPTGASLLALVNTERAKVHVTPLTEDSRLDASAQYKAQDMVTRNYFAHADPITGKDNGINKIFELTGGLCSYGSENLTDNTVVNDSQHAVDTWVKSKPHYEAMVNPRYTLTGFGIEGTKVVEHFCQPA